MGTRIKPIKCPNCGSEKHTQKDDKCYLCQSCGTEFYIDDDDININVNHHFDYIPTSNDTTEIGKKLGIYFYSYSYRLRLHFITHYLFINRKNFFKTIPKRLY